jgi:putative membrane protein
VLALSAIVASTRFLNWRSAGIGTDERALAVRSGVIGQKHVRIGRNRIQSLHVRQGPFQRRAGIATLVVLSVAGSSRSAYAVAHLPLADADVIAEWYHRGTEASTRPA